MTENKLIIIGLTGSIAMGKSVTAKIFLQAGIPVFDSDAAVHKLLAAGGAGVDQVSTIFPGVLSDGAIDRKMLGTRVFGDLAALKQLEEILHPLVSKQRAVFFEQAQKAGHDMVVVDVPLLFETGADKICDYVVVVSAPEDLQRTRVLSRPHMTEQKFADILAKQMPDAEKRQRADFVVHSDQGLDYAEQQVRLIIEEIRRI